MDAGSRVQARHKGAWAKTGQGFTVYNVNCPLSHLIKLGWTEGTAPPKFSSSLPTGLPKGWGTHHVYTNYISIPKHPLEVDKSRRVGGAQMRERSHERVWSGRASWRKSSEGHSKHSVVQVKVGEGTGHSVLEK